MLRYNLLKTLLFVAFAGVITISLQGWVGVNTIYSKKLAAKRQVLHQSILENKPPEGYTWKMLGATNSLKIRVFTVFFVEKIHQLTKYEPNTIYMILDTFCIFATILALFAYLKKWLENIYCLVGVMYYCCILPLTYFLHYFHPWDRLSLLIWIFLLYLLREEKMLIFIIVLLFSITVKFDTILLPGLYFLYKASRENWQKTILTTAGLFIMTFSAYYLLNKMFPGNAESGLGYGEVFYQVKKNFLDMIALNLRYPPLLGFVIPGVLAFMGLQSKEKYVSACVVFGFILIIPWFLFSNFREIRAEMVFLVLLLPSSLISLKILLNTVARSSGV
jgi:hypothetical protein